MPLDCEVENVFLNSMSFYLSFLFLFLSFSQEILRGCFEQVEEFLRSLAPPATMIAPQSTSSSSTSSCPVEQQTNSPVTAVVITAKTEHEKAGTPTDVRDIHF